MDEIAFNREGLQHAADLLNRGVVVGVPTDTVYGIAADPRNSEAVARLFVLKARTEQKPIGVLVADTEAALEILELPAYALEWVAKFWPGPLNLVGKARVEMLAGVGNHTKGTLGVRVPDHQTTLRLLHMFGPLAVTSANLAGGPETLDDIEARSMLGAQVEFYVPGRCPGAVSSTTVDVSGPGPVLLRQGPLDLGLKLGGLPSSNL